MASTDLNPEKRDQVVAFKTTQTEKESIEAHCKKLIDGGVDVSKYLRHLVFTDIEKAKK